MKILRIALICLAGVSVLLLDGCASIVSGSTQTVTVSTPPVTGASCVLKNNKGQWRVYSTPGVVNVHRSYDSLNVTCVKRYHRTAHAIETSHTKAVAFGNVFFGGIIGGAVDAGTGAAYDYPSNIIVPMS